jgi:8-oxo-dGTP pyrophosphatase MutT (NUDIX family)
MKKNHGFTSYSRTHNIIYCANCGGMGHIYKNCNHPVTSCGILCFRMRYDKTTHSIVPEYLMVQRKDSMSYVEFIRGKYALENRAYLGKLLSNMTRSEHAALRAHPFDTLWKNLWQIQECKNFVREYQEAKHKFEQLQRGYMLRDSSTNALSLFSLNHALDATQPMFEETEWGFPKGRRNINEDDVTCALREFCEESGYRPNNLNLLKECKPLEEVFSGTNKVRYRHVYYLAHFTALPSDPTTMREHMTRVMIREIKDVKWLDYRTAQSAIRDHYVERKELLKRVNQWIVKVWCQANA